MNISEFVANRDDKHVEEPEDTDKVEEKEKKADKEAARAERDRKNQEFFSAKAQERADKKKLEKDGLELFFTNNNYIPATPEEFEGHYPGNQNNVVLIPHEKRVKHVSGK